MESMILMLKKSAECLIKRLNFERSIQGTMSIKPMNFYNRLRTLACLMALAGFVSCQTTTTTTTLTAGDSTALVDTSKSIPNTYAAEYYKLTANYKDAFFTDTIRNSRAFYFSDPKANDSFIIVVPPGLIASSKSQFMIKTAAGKIIYNETFPTRHFARESFDADTIPADAVGDEYDKFKLKHAREVTREQIQKTTANKIAKFYDKNIFADRSVLSNNSEDEILDKPLFKELVADKNARIITLPCFDCDEGQSFIAYSKKRQKALIFLASD
jgi:hypothetical protein